MSKIIHKRFIQISKEVSPALFKAIDYIGPVELSRRRSHSFAAMLCRVVAGQQLSVKAARTIWGRVLDQAKGQSFVSFLSQAHPKDLRVCGLSAAKSKAMACIAQAALGGDIHPLRLRPLDQAERTKRLTAIWGVGQWTADMMNMFYFGDEDVWPGSDIAVQKTFQRLVGRRKKSWQTARSFSPYRSYLALYMWRWADNKPA